MQDGILALDPMSLGQLEGPVQLCSSLQISLKAERSVGRETERE